MIWGQNTTKKCKYGTRNPQRNSWGDKFSYYIDPYASCGNDAEILEGKDPSYCKEHGCPQCFYEVGGSHKVDDNWLCKEHYNKHLGDKKLAEIEDQVNKIKSLDSQLETELKGISNDFYILLKEPVYFLNQVKEKLIRQQITNQMFAAVAGGSIIDTYSTLSPTENNNWKGIYDPTKQMADICQTEKAFLVSLAKEYKNKSEVEKARLAEEARQKAETERKRQEELRKEQEEEQKKLEREKNKREQGNDSNDNEKNFPNSDKLNNSPPTNINPSPQTNDSDKRERERENRATHEKKNPPPQRKDGSKLVKKTDNTSIYLASGTIGVAIIATIGGIVAFLKIKKRNNSPFRKKK